MPKWKVLECDDVGDGTQKIKALAESRPLRGFRGVVTQELKKSHSDEGCGLLVKPPLYAAVISVVNAGLSTRGVIWYVAGFSRSLTKAVTPCCAPFSNAGRTADQSKSVGNSATGVSTFAGAWFQPSVMLPYPHPDHKVEAPRGRLAATPQLYVIHG
jgi:hypothetical protein